MSMQSLLTGWTVPTQRSETRIRSYSTTGDILSYQRCRRQYGYFHVRGFSSASATQQYFGTLVHDVLDRINREYKITPTLPDLPTVEALVDDAHDRLWRSGVRTYSARQQRDLATKLIYRFVQLIGPCFFPNVRETEYQLKRVLRTPANTDYSLHGVVDVLSGAVSHALNLPYSTEADDIEIWDYKSGQMPDKNSREMKSYEYQMRVYAELYRQQTGDFPARCVLVFVGELGSDSRWNQANMDPAYFPKLVYPIHPVQRHVTDAVDNFHQTVEEIEVERKKPYAQQWLPPAHPVDKQTCEACELRYNCTSFPTGVAQRRQAL